MNQSDSTQQSNVNMIPDDAAVIWSKQLAWIDYSVYQYPQDSELPRHLMELKASLASGADEKLAETIERLEARIAKLDMRQTAGLSAQAVKTLIDETGYGSYVVSTVNGKLQLDFVAIQAIVNHGLQVRAARIEKFLSGVLGSGITV